MRLQPVAHAGLRRVATRDVTFSNGLVVPKGTTVLGSQLSLMSDPAWGWQDPDAFKPVRRPDVRLGTSVRAGLQAACLHWRDCWRALQLVQV